MPCSPLLFSMRPVQIPCRFFLQVLDSAYLCRTCIDDIKILCCLFIYIYDIFVILNTVKDLRLPLQVSKRRYFRMTDGPTETPVRYHHPLPSTHSSVILNAVKDLRLFHPSIQENDLRHPLPNARIKNLHPNLQIITLRSRTMNSSTKTQTEKPA